MRCSTARRSYRPIRRKSGSNGIAAPIWSKASAIAARATRRATHSARRARRLSRRRVGRGWEAPALTLAVAGADARGARMNCSRYLRTGESRFARRRGRADGAGGEGIEGAARCRHPRHGGAISPRSTKGAPTSRPPKRSPQKLENTTQLARPRPPGRRPALSGRLRGVPRGRRAARCSAAGRRWRSNSNLHSDAPDNLIQMILHGIAAPP